MAISLSGKRPDSFRIGKTADILPTRLPVTLAYDSTWNGTARRCFRGWGVPIFRSLLR